MGAAGKAGDTVAAADESASTADGALNTDVGAALVEISSVSKASSRQASSASRSSSSTPSGVPYERPNISPISPTSSSRSGARKVIGDHKSEIG